MCFCNVVDKCFVVIHLKLINVIDQEKRNWPRRHGSLSTCPSQQFYIFSHGPLYKLDLQSKHNLL